MTKDEQKKLLLPFGLTAVVILLDQVSKLIVASQLPVGARVKIVADLVWFWHVRNTGMAFSLGSRLPTQLRSVIFLILPLAVLLLLLIYYFKSKDIKGIQRWCFAAILGGGLGNLIDRFLRPEGVVDFISIKFYGLLGMERYPTFNLADSTVVVAAIIMILSYLTGQRRHTE
jgi:signal peptidase II